MKPMINRRDFLRTALISALACRAYAADVAREVAAPRREALHYRKLSDGRGTVQCALCPRRCTIADGSSGFCRARRNYGGTLISLGYAMPCTLHLDPIEKKPFFNYYPKTTSFSLACAGCNLRCKFCQNWEISQISPLESRNILTPVAQLPDMAKGQGARSIAFTYTEPTTYYEYMIEAAKAAQAKGILSVYHSNGYINPEPLQDLCRHLDAANVDLKGFSENFYTSVCEATLAPVLETLKILRKSGVWLEITNLVIPGYNDDPRMIGDMCQWIHANLGAETPVHFSRFFPLYKMVSVPPTPVKTLERARETALKAGLKYPYIGNVPGHAGNSTYCPKCSRMVIKRGGFNVLAIYLKGGRCSFCGERIHGHGLQDGGIKA
jgi:pyruvate formate lyase activating enzyme